MRDLLHLGRFGERLGGPHMLHRAVVADAHGDGARRLAPPGVVAPDYGEAVPQQTSLADLDGDGRPDDGGLFTRLAGQVHAAGPLALPGATRRPKAARAVRTRAPRMRFTTTVRRLGSGKVVVRVRAIAPKAARGVLAIQLYKPGAGTTPTLQQDFRALRFRAGVPRTFTARFAPRGAGRWQVKVGLFDEDFRKLLVWQPDAARFTLP